jgi:HAD superfamily hydrolase (TIGR01662 family)
MTTIRAVVFDVGETLVDETATWDDWADWLGVPRFTFQAVLGGVIALGLHHHVAFELLKPGIDLDAEHGARRAAGRRSHVTMADFYPDAVPCLRSLVDAGYRVGIAANQPETSEEVLRALDVPLALVASSARWRIVKPDPAFFVRICMELELPPEQIAYVGDRIDNDIEPALAVGMAAIQVRRGPWAMLQLASRYPTGPRPHPVIESLSELPDVLSRLGPPTALESP